MCWRSCAGHVKILSTEAGIAWCFIINPCKFRVVARIYQFTGLLQLIVCNLITTNGPQKVKMSDLTNLPQFSPSASFGSVFFPNSVS